MSVRFNAIAALACRVPVDKLKRTIRRRGCDHVFLAVESMNFCPFCGSRVWIDVDDWIFDRYKMNIDGLKVIGSTDDREMFVCAAAVSTSDGENSKMISFGGYSPETLKDQVRRVLDEYGLWDENQWGLWAIPNISY